MEATDFLHLALEMLSHHFCCIILIRSDAISSTAVVKKFEYQENKSSQIILKAAYCT